MTYPFLRSYLKHFFFTANSWRPQRDSEGWKVPGSRSVQLLEDGLEDESDEEDNFISKVLAQVSDACSRQEPITLETFTPREVPVDFITPVPGLSQDVDAMLSFCRTPNPLMLLLYPVKGVYCVGYGFVDASGEGKGGTFWRRTPHGTRLELADVGFWCSEISERSSNYRELRNLVEHVKKLARLGRVVGMEVWIITDNEVTERVFYKGGSDSKDLHFLILELKHCEVEGNFVLHVVHAAGTRMIGEGTDGLSRGEVHAQGLLDPRASIVITGEQHVVLPESKQTRIRVVVGECHTLLGFDVERNLPDVLQQPDGVTVFITNGEPRGGTQLHLHALATLAPHDGVNGYQVLMIQL